MQRTTLLIKSNQALGLASNHLPSSDWSFNQSIASKRLHTESNRLDNFGSRISHIYFYNQDDCSDIVLWQQFLKPTKINKQRHLNILKHITRFVISVALTPVVGKLMFWKHIAQRNASFKNIQLGATTHLNLLTRVRDNTSSNNLHVWVCSWWILLAATLWWLPLDGLHSYDSGGCFQEE